MCDWDLDATGLFLDGILSLLFIPLFTIYFVIGERKGAEEDWECLKDDLSRDGCLGYPRQHTWEKPLRRGEKPHV